MAPVRVGDCVCTAESVSGDLERKWSLETKVVSRARGDVIFVDDEEEPYHPWRIKVVPGAGDSLGDDSPSSLDSGSRQDGVVSANEVSSVSGGEELVAEDDGSSEFSDAEAMGLLLSGRGCFANRRSSGPCSLVSGRLSSRFGRTTDRGGAGLT